MRRGIGLILVVALSAAMVFAQDDFAMVTRLPRTYVIDYNTEDRPWQESIDAYSQAPPDLLHLSVVMNWNFRCGPILGLGDKDWRDYDLQWRARIGPEELQAREPELRGFVEALHEAGVEKVTPYICLITMFGNHETREGFWDFYDHWDDYRDIGLYPKPQSDPFTWNQLGPDGEAWYYYPHDLEYVQPFLRYAMSPAHPQWRRWISFVVRDVAELGMDGVFVDNSTGCRDFGPHARQHFERRIRERYSEGEMADLFGGMPEMQEDLGSLAAFETWMTWMEIIREYEAVVREAGEEVCGEGNFIVFPNGGQNREHLVPYAFRDVDYLMFERSRGTVPGSWSTRVIGPFELQHSWDNLFAYAATLGAGGRVRAQTLIGEGRPRGRLGLNHNALLLAHAEAAAFSGGGMARGIGPLRDMAEAMSLYDRHYDRCRDLYDGLTPWSKAAVALFGTEYFYGNRGQVGQAEAAYDALIARHIPTDVLTTRGCFIPNLHRYDLIVLPDVRFISEEQMRALRTFRREGGDLLVFGQTGRYDDRMREREDNPLAELSVGDAFDFEALEAKLAEMRETLPPLLAVDGLPDMRRRWAIKPAMYIDSPRDPSRIVVHLLNYNVEIGRDFGQVTPVPSAHLRVPLPDDFVPQRARVIRVEDESEEIAAVGIEGQFATVGVHDLGIHTIIVVE